MFSNNIILGQKYIIEHKENKLFFKQFFPARSKTKKLVLRGGCILYLYGFNPEESHVESTVDTVSHNVQVDVVKIQANHTKNTEYFF